MPSRASLESSGSWDSHCVFLPKVSNEKELESSHRWYFHPPVLLAGKTEFCARAVMEDHIMGEDQWNCFGMSGRKPPLHPVQHTKGLEFTVA